MPRSVSHRVELIFGVVSLTLCIGAVIWAFAFDVRDASPGGYFTETNGEVVQDDLVGKDGMRHLTPRKAGFVALVLIAGLSVAGGAVLHTFRQRGASVGGIWLGGLILFVCAVATIRTLGMPLFTAATSALIAALASTVSSVPGGVTPTRHTNRKSGLAGAWGCDRVP